MPADRSATGDDTRLLHPAADLLQADPVQPNPGKDQPDNAGFFRHYLKARHTPAKGLGHVATAIGAGDEGADHSPPARNGSAQTHGTTWRISTIQNSIDTGSFQLPIRLSICRISSAIHSKISKDSLARLGGFRSPQPTTLKTLQRAKPGGFLFVRSRAHALQPSQHKSDPWRRGLLGRQNRTNRLAASGPSCGSQLPRLCSHQAE